CHELLSVFLLGHGLLLRIVGQRAMMLPGHVEHLLLVLLLRLGHSQGRLLHHMFLGLRHHGARQKCKHLITPRLNCVGLGVVHPRRRQGKPAFSDEPQGTAAALNAEIAPISPRGTAAAELSAQRLQKEVQQSVPEGFEVYSLLAAASAVPKTLDRGSIAGASRSAFRAAVLVDVNVTILNLLGAGRGAASLNAIHLIATEHVPGRHFADDPGIVVLPLHPLFDQLLFLPRSHLSVSSCLPASQTVSQLPEIPRKCPKNAVSGRLSTSPSSAAICWYHCWYRSGR